MNILITNFHSIQNKGDLGIVLGLIAGLKTKWPAASFGVIGRESAEADWWLAKGIKFYQPVLTYQPTSRLTFLIFLARFFSTLVLIKTNQTPVVAAYRQADLVVSKGGSFFREPEYRRNWLPIGILGHLHQLLVARKLGKKVVLSAQSFGPINNPVTRLIISREFKKLALITARDGDSARFLIDRLGLRVASVVGDSAFLLPVTASAIKLSSTKYRRVGLTVRSWSNQAEFLQYQQAIIGLIGQYANQFEFVFMPQVIGPRSYEDDRRVATEIFTQLPPAIQARVTIVKDNLAPEELVGLYGQMDFFIATRLHSAIFALLAGRPLVAIGYEPKTIGVLGDLKLGEWVLDLRSITPANLEAKFTRLLKASPTEFTLAAAAARQSALKNIDLIAAVVN